MLEKGFAPRWTEMLFRISKIVLTITITYKIIDLNEEENWRVVLWKELQKTTQDIFRIEKY